MTYADEGFRIIDVWESEEAWMRFRFDRLRSSEEPESLHVPPVLRAVRPAHIFIGEREKQ